MMAKRTVPRPTDAELEILRVLWERGPCTVRQVFTELSQSKPTGYTTALKLMQIMAEKGLVERDVSERTHVYTPRLSEEQTQRRLVKDLVDRAFGGSSLKLVMQALSANEASPKEIEEIHHLLAEMGNGKDGRKQGDGE